MKITIHLEVEIEDKHHPMPWLVKFIENRTCTIPGVLDANGKEVDVAALPVVDTPPRAAA